MKIEACIVPLTRGQFTIVDEADFGWVSQWRWYAAPTSTGDWRAVRNGPRPKRGMVYMHRILTFAEPGEDVDHIDGDGLNNTQSNLRRCTHQENSRGFRRQSPGKSSIYRGVSWNTFAKKWQAQIAIRAGAQRHIGYFDNEEDAARAYRVSVQLHFGAFAEANLLSQIRLKSL